MAYAIRISYQNIQDVNKTVGDYFRNSTISKEKVISMKVKDCVEGFYESK